MKDITIGFALCGSFCTFAAAIKEMEKLSKAGVKILPIMSQAAAFTDTRFGKAEDIREKIEKICGQAVIADISGAEPIGPKGLINILLIAPCTGNTLAKLANGITDTTVTMAAKSHLRNLKPVLIAISTNDGLAGSAKNIGRLLNRKNIFFVPYGQDDAFNKPASLMSDFTKIPAALESALKGEQLQPVLIS
ncbi:MAG: dipicolinate synthase subunit B [Oscillospiraceae bacterium]|nr:dipicolinate synthase subunit B [Oscillospiraceae bacterium]